MKDRALFAEVRPVFLPYSAHEDPFLVNGYTLQGYVNYELCINANDQVLFEGLSPKRRNNVRSSLRRGVIVKESRSADATSLLYGLLSESHARSKLPLAHKSYFDAAIEQLPKQSCRILIAYHHGTPIAGGCFLAHKNRVTCWYAGTKRVSGIAATSLIFWEAIKLYSSLGYEIFDFAGGGWEGESYGPGKFKSKFGGEKIHTGRYRKIFAPRKLQIAELLFKTFRSWLSP